MIRAMLCDWSMTPYEPYSQEDAISHLTIILHKRQVVEAISREYQAMAATVAL